VGNIQDFLSEEITVDAFKDRLLAALTGDKFVHMKLDPEEIAEVERHAEEKYRSWEWTYGSAPPYSAKRFKKRYDGGSLEVCVDVVEGRIESILIHGDFMARASLHPLIEALTGRRLERGEIAGVLAAFPIEEMFGGITREEILEVIIGDYSKND
jgi:lipoate-protein ligase A